jgi:hypothetical protein
VLAQDVRGCNRHLELDLVAVLLQLGVTVTVALVVTAVISMDIVPLLVL